MTMSHVIIVAIVMAPFAAWLLGLFRRDGIRGPVRIGAEMRIGPIVMLTAVATLVWILVQAGYVAKARAAFMHIHPKDTWDTTLLSNADFAFLGTVPFAIGLLILVIGDVVLGSQWPRRIGYTLGNLLRGVGTGILAMLVVLPVMWAASMAFEVFYRAIHFEHPAEHELLGAMKDAPVQIRALLIVAACVIAPVFEELLFRGHLQTILVRLFTPRPKVALLPPLEITAAAPARDAIAMPATEPLPLDYERPESNRPRWLAVLVTSLIFALFHPIWMAPLIFVLAICLGYAYERTGNLWVTITMHAVFNTFNTLFFLNFM